jgi:hypothetical protein
VADADAMNPHRRPARFFTPFVSFFTETTDTTGQTMNPNAYPLEFLYDGHCAICRFDVANFRRFGGIFRQLTPECADGLCSIPERIVARNRE